MKKARNRQFTVIAHRGARGYAPENTLKAFDKAIELGAMWIELDVQLHERRLLVIHDLTLDRTTSGAGRVADCNFGYLRSLDAGQGQKIPTLEEVLDRVNRRARLNIELKTAGGTAAALAQVLRKYLRNGWRARDFLVSSFILPELREFRKRMPRVATGVLLMGVPLDLAACATRIGAKTLNISDEFAEPALIADAHRRGLKVYVYTVNATSEIRYFRKLGVDGIFTDYPERVILHGAQQIMQR